MSRMFVGTGLCRLARPREPARDPGARGRPAPRAGATGDTHTLDLGLGQGAVVPLESPIHSRITQNTQEQYLNIKRYKHEHTTRFELSLSLCDFMHRMPSRIRLKVPVQHTPVAMQSPAPVLYVF